MDVDFCSQCENLLYLYIDKQDKIIHHKCKSCGFSKKLENKNIEINNNTKINVTKCDIINHNPQNMILRYHLLKIIKILNV